MLHLTLQALLDLSKYTQKQNNWPNEVVENQKYEGCYPMVTFIPRLSSGIELNFSMVFSKQKWTSYLLSGRLESGKSTCSFLTSE